MSRRYRCGDMGGSFRLTWCGFASAVRRSALAQPSEGEVVAPVGERVHAVCAERRVRGGPGERAGVGSGSRLLAGHMVVRLRGLNVRRAELELELDHAAMARAGAELKASQQRARGPVLPERGGGEEGEAVGAGAMHDASGECRADPLVLQLVGDLDG